MFLIFKVDIELSSHVSTHPSSLWTGKDTFELSLERHFVSVVLQVSYPDVYTQVR